MGRLIITLMLFLAGRPVLAQDLPWNELVYTSRTSIAYRPAVVADPADLSGESWYAFTPTYLWHTEDMGATVQEVSTDGLENLIFSGLAVAHDAPSILYLATGINQYHGGGHALDPSRETSRFEGDGVYQSRDRGGTWQRLPFFAGVPAARDLHVLKSISTSSLGDTVLVTTTHRILLSVDAGQTWSVAYDLPRLTFSPGLHSDHSVGHARIYHHPRSLRHLFVTVGPATNHSNPRHSYVLVSHDGGESWDFLQVDNYPPTETPEQKVTWLFAADPKDPNVFWAQVANSAYTIQRKIFRSGDGGQTWTDVPVVKREGADFWAGTHRARSIHVHPQGGDTLVLGWTPGHYQDGRLVTEGIQGQTPIHFLVSADSYRGFRMVEDNPGQHRDVHHSWMVAWTVNETGAADAIRTGELPLSPYFGDVCTSPVPAGADAAHRYFAVGHPTLSGRSWRVEPGDTPPPRTP
ncbi:MAG: exo-alpha-sialidase, partial [Rhodothermaceae bacterium]|nr:exo-alpha-sialidase [Rhodothermaceae bacterium]